MDISINASIVYVSPSMLRCLAARRRAGFRKFQQIAARKQSACRPSSNN
jgi:hypothetical protein